MKNKYACEVEMARKSSIIIAKPKIETFLKNNNQNIYSPTALEGVFYSSKNDWRLSASTTAKQFIDFLLEKSILKKITLDFPTQSVTRYVYGEESAKNIYQLALSLKPKSYISHYSAIFLNNLTEQIPKNIFITFEQPRKNRPDNSLTQEKIDEAFKKPVRKTVNVAQFGDFNITLINGQYTDKAGVLKRKENDGNTISLTNIERTLIDAAVRPEYSGGVLEVLKAYKNASGLVQVNKLKAYLKQIDFIYPYHQVIGFYLEKAGLSDKRLAHIENSFEKTFDFYLAHNMQDMLYSQRWRLYYPSALE